MNDLMLTKEQIEAIKARRAAIKKHDADSEEMDEFYDNAPADIDALTAAYEWLRNEFVSACEELEAEQADNERLRTELATHKKVREGILADMQARYVRLPSVNNDAGQDTD